MGIHQNLQKQLMQIWETRIHKGFLYHGTSTLFLPSIRTHGLNPKIKPYDVNDITKLSRILVKAGSVRFPVERVGLWVDKNKFNSNSYAREGPERINYIVGIAKEILNSYKVGRIRPKNLKKLTSSDFNFLEEIIKKYSGWFKKHKPVVLWIPYNSWSIIRQVDNQRKKIITNFGFFEHCVVTLVNSGYSVDFAVDAVFFSYFHNKLLKKPIAKRDIKVYEILK